MLKPAGLWAEDAYITNKANASELLQEWIQVCISTGGKKAEAAHHPKCHIAQHSGH